MCGTLIKALVCCRSGIYFVDNFNCKRPPANQITSVTPQPEPAGAAWFWKAMKWKKKIIVCLNKIFFPLKISGPIHGVELRCYVEMDGPQDWGANEPLANLNSSTGLKDNLTCVS